MQSQPNTQQVNNMNPPAITPRRTQVFVTDSADPSVVLDKLSNSGPVQLIPLATASDAAERIASALRAIGVRVAITRPLPHGVDGSEAASIMRV